MMKYKGYVARVTFDDEARLFHGDVLGIRSVITFQGKSVDELERAFKDSINDYIHWCKERGKEAEKPFSGNVHIRMSPTDHERLATQAASCNMSINSFVIEKLTGRNK